MKLIKEAKNCEIHKISFFFTCIKYKITECCKKIAIVGIST